MIFIRNLLVLNFSFILKAAYCFQLSFCILGEDRHVIMVLQGEYSSRLRYQWFLL